MQLLADCGRLVRESGAIVRQYRRPLLCALALVCAGIALILPLDAGRAPKPDVVYNRGYRRFAVEVRRWGDYQTGSLIVAGLLWILGWLRRARRWQTAALACFLAATFAGLEVNVLRFTVGRPRPSVKVPDRLRGPTLGNNYHSFPSAHSATSFGTAGALAIALPPVGAPAVVGAMTVAWSRLYLKSHYPTDVWTGACVGLLTGVVLGLAARRIARWQASPAATADGGLSVLSTAQRR